MQIATQGKHGIMWMEPVLEGIMGIAAPADLQGEYMVVTSGGGLVVAVWSPQANALDVQQFDSVDQLLQTPRADNIVCGPAGMYHPWVARALINYVPMTDDQKASALKLVENRLNLLLIERMAAVQRNESAVRALHVALKNGPLTVQNWPAIDFLLAKLPDGEGIIL